MTIEEAAEAQLTATHALIGAMVKSIDDPEITAKIDARVAAGVKAGIEAAMDTLVDQVAKRILAPLVAKYGQEAVSTIVKGEAG